MVRGNPAFAGTVEQPPRTPAPMHGGWVTRSHPVTLTGGKGVAQAVAQFVPTGNEKPRLTACRGLLYDLTLRCPRVQQQIKRALFQHWGYFRAPVVGPDSKALLFGTRAPQRHLWTHAKAQFPDRPSFVSNRLPSLEVQLPRRGLLDRIDFWL